VFGLPFVLASGVQRYDGLPFLLSLGYDDPSCAVAPVINDMARLSGDNKDFEALLGGRVHGPEVVEGWGNTAGFELDMAIAPTVEVETHARAHRGQGTGRAPAGRHRPHHLALQVDGQSAEAIAEEALWPGAFQFSGGRDSTAALYMLRPYWQYLRVYHLDTGDHFPETRAVVEQVERDLAEVGVVIERITTDVKADRETYGYPTDLVPVGQHPVRATGRPGTNCASRGATTAARGR
jgi:hypothetical protein